MHVFTFTNVLMFCVLQESGLFQAMVNLSVDGTHYQIYADSAYVQTANMAIPIPRAAAPEGSPEAALNKTMAVVRTCTSEWQYGIITNTFQALDFARWQRQWLTIPAIQYVCATLFVNMRTCMDGMNRVSEFFDCSPPTLDEYLNDQL